LHVAQDLSGGENSGGSRSTTTIPRNDSTARLGYVDLEQGDAEERMVLSWA
jgi:hypothetical protein